MSLQVQFLTLSLMAGSGAVLGIGYDLIEVLAKEFKLRRWTTAIMDVVYWLAATLFVFQVLVYANDGQVRLFVFIGLLVGVVIYAYMLSRLVRQSVTWVITLLVRVLYGLMRVLHVVIIRPLLYIYRFLLIIFGFIITASTFLGRSMLQWIRYVSKWIMRRF